jgi:hypothetical protein
VAEELRRRHDFLMAVSKYEVYRKRKSAVSKTPLRCLAPPPEFFPFREAQSRKIRHAEIRPCVTIMSLHLHNPTPSPCQEPQTCFKIQIVPVPFLLFATKQSILPTPS